MYKYIVTFFCFFPYIGVFAEFDVQPFFLLLVSLGIFFSMVSGRLVLNSSAGGLFILAIFIVFLRQSVDEFFVSDANPNYISMATTIFHILTIYFVFVGLKNKLIVVTSNVLMVVFSLYLIVGLVQLLDESFLSFLVSRGYQTLGDTGRGVRSLASEPAVFGHLLIMIYTLLVYLSLGRSSFKIRSVYLSLIFILFSAVLAQSFYSLFFMTLFGLSLMMSSYYLIRIGVLVVVVLAVATISAIEFNTNTRAFYILDALLHNPYLLYEQGAMLRLLNIPISIEGSISHGILGSGFTHNTVYSFLSFTPQIPYRFSIADRNMGGFVEFYLRLGVLALPLLIVYTLVLKKIWKSLNHTLFIRVWLLSVLFYISFTYSSLANPLLWVVLFYIYINETGNRNARLQ